jgi:cyclopropane-fatty-acyl-phospholipid synthase
MWYQGILDRGWVPDWMIRRAIRKRCATRLATEDQGDPAAQERRLAGFLDELRAAPIAAHTDLANEQHYELPPEFFTTVLGRHRKYSCGYWPAGCSSLDASEEHMLDLTASRADLADGQRILDLGCGWGSVSLYLAERFPAAEILAVSNSNPQREFITAAARSRRLDNLEVRTADINTFEPADRFDRVVSVEMFEHMKNYGELLRRICGWLKPEGSLFVHIFVHRRFAYHYQAEGPDDWMARHFFTGGTMPSFDLLEHFSDHLEVAEKWRVDGTHYQKTCEAWLRQMDSNRNALRPILAATYGPAEVTRWWVRWRVFFMACAELFGYAGGKEWFVGHYLLRPRNPEKP